MRKRNKLFTALILSMVMMVAFSGAVSAAFPDIQGHWAQASVERWLGQGLVAGYPDGTFRPDNEVSRAEFITFVDRAFELPVVRGFTGFTDVDEGEWYYGHVVSAVQTGILSGYPDGSFGPQHSITRQEAASVLQRLLGLEEVHVLMFDDHEEIGSWARVAVKTVVHAEIMGGYPDNTFRPVAPITRAETVTVLDRALQYSVPEPPVVDCEVVSNEAELRAALQDRSVERICFEMEYVLEAWGLDEELDVIDEEDVVPGDPGLFRMLREEGITHMVIGEVAYDLSERDDLDAIREVVMDNAGQLLNDGLQVTLIHETEGPRTAIYRII